MFNLSPCSYLSVVCLILLVWYDNKNSRMQVPASFSSSVIRVARLNDKTCVRLTPLHDYCMLMAWRSWSGHTFYPSCLHKSDLKMQKYFSMILVLFSCLQWQAQKIWKLVFRSAKFRIVRSQIGHRISIYKSVYLKWRKLTQERMATLISLQSLCLLQLSYNGIQLLYLSNTFTKATS